MKVFRFSEESLRAAIDCAKTYGSAIVHAQEALFYAAYAEAHKKEEYLDLYFLHGRNYIKGLRIDAVILSKNMQGGVAFRGSPDPSVGPYKPMTSDEIRANGVHLKNKPPRFNVLKLYDDGSSHIMYNACIYIEPHTDLPYLAAGKSSAVGVGRMWGNHKITKIDGL